LESEEHVSLPTYSEISRKFGKKKLLLVAADLEIGVDPSKRINEVIDILLDDIDENGVPDVSLDDDTLFGFLLFLQYIDEDGNLIDDDAVDDPEEEDDTADEDPVQEPPIERACFGYSEPDYVPACAACQVNDACARKRDEIVAGMYCFGRLYDSGHEQCSNCTLWRICKETMEEKNV